MYNKYKIKGHSEGLLSSSLISTEFYGFSNYMHKYIVQNARFLIEL